MRQSVGGSERKGFLFGVLSLTLSTLLVKLIGLFYKIPMLSYLGTEGMGYFNSAYEIYALFCVIATAGLPVALSVLISEALARNRGAEVRRIYRATLAVFLLVGAVGTLLLWGLAEPLCRMIGSGQTKACIRAISPTVFFVCLSSAIRGYFQGYQKMTPTALSQLLEAVGKLAFGVCLARYALLKGYGTPTVAAYAAFGLTLGTAAGALYLIFKKLCFSPLEERNGIASAAEATPVLKRLCRLAVPMTLGASLVSLTKLIDMTMILRRLQSVGFNEVVANEAYGSYTTLALSVFGLLPSLISSVSLPLVPVLSSAIASNDSERQSRTVRLCYRLTALFSLPAALGISAFSRPVLLLLFGSAPEAVAFAAPLLSCLGVSVFLSCMISVTNSVLHAYRIVNRPILSMLTGSAVKLVSAYFLIGTPSVALLGAPISTFLCNATVVLLNLLFTVGLCRMPSFKEVFFRPFACALGAVGIALPSYSFLAGLFGESPVLTLAALFFTVLVYFVAACLTGGIGEEDLRELPGGERLVALFFKLRLLRKSRRT